MPPVNVTLIRKVRFLKRLFLYQVLYNHFETKLGAILLQTSQLLAVLDFDTIPGQWRDKYPMLSLYHYYGTIPVLVGISDSLDHTEAPVEDVVAFLPGYHDDKCSFCTARATAKSKLASHGST